VQSLFGDEGPAGNPRIGGRRDRTGNLPPLYGIFPDHSAPIVRNQPEGRELMMARWGTLARLCAEGQEFQSRRHQCP